MRSRLHMVALAAAFVLPPSIVPAQAPSSVRESPAEDPRQIVRAAELAVAHDSEQALAARWRVQLRAGGPDRGARLGLATLARLTYSLADADRQYRALAAQRSVDRYTPWILLGQGLVLEMQGHARRIEAFEEARRTARTLGDRTAEGAALLELAFSGLGSRGVAPTLMALDTVKRLLPASDAGLHARRLRYESVARVVSGDSMGRHRALESIALSRRSGDVREEAAAHRTIGLHYTLRGSTDSALARFDTAEALFRRGRDRRGLAYTLLFRADHLSSLGRIGEAKLAIERALPEAQAGQYLVGIGHVHVALASVASRVGDYRTALSHVRDAIAVYDTLGDRHSLTLTHALRAQILLMAGDAEGAQRDSTWVLDIVRNNPEAQQRVEAQQVLVSAALATGRVAEAERLVVEAERLAHAVGFRSWTTRLLMSRARIAQARGDAAATGRLAAQFLRMVDTTQRVARYEARVLLAESRAQQGDVAQAARELAAAGMELDRWRRTLTDQELRVLAFQSASPDFGALDAGIARVLNAVARDGDPGRAFELAEARRARELMERMTIRAALATTPTAHKPGLDRTSSEPVTLARVQAALPPGTALLQYVVGTDTAPTTVFVVTNGEIAAHSLAPADSLRAPITRFASLLEAGADPRPLATALGESLLGRALAALPSGVMRLLVVPDGVLHLVPFDALRYGDAFVVERFAVATAPSAGVAIALLERAPRVSRASRLVAFGDPDFGDVSAGGAQEVPGPGAVPSIAGSRAGTLPRLEGSAHEVAMAARYAADAIIYQRASASAARLKQASLRDIAVLHFATHALVDDQSLTGSVLALAPSHGESGFVTPHELAALRMDADLVVLSACRTAAGAIVDGEGVMGLTAPLLEAGARSVVATRWQIADRGSVPFVRAFYDALAAGQPVADALRSAKLDAIRRGAPPAEWAAFQVIGNPMVRVPLRTPRWQPPASFVVSAGILMLLIAVSYGARTMKRRASDRRSVPSPA